MANNCLVTKLKGSVLNNELPFYGCLRFHSIPNEQPNYAQRAIECRSFNGQNYKAVALKGYFTDSTGTQNLGTVIEKSTGVIYFANVECDVIVNLKYDLYYVYVGNELQGDADSYACVGYNSTVPKVIYLPVNSFGDVSGWSGTYQSIDIYNSPKITGSLKNVVITDRFLIDNAKNISEGPTLSPGMTGTLRISGTNINLADIYPENYLGEDLRARSTPTTGNLADYMTANLNTIDFIYSNVTGTVESCVEKLWALGRRTTFNQFSKPGTVTINGHESNMDLKLLFTNNGCTVTSYFDTSQVFATFDGSNWTYPA